MLAATARHVATSHLAASGTRSAATKVPEELGGSVELERTPERVHR
jgi:hypothetical protein